MTLDVADVMREFGPGMLRTAVSYERNPALREELLQDIYMALLTALPRLQDPARLRAYVYKVAHHRCVSHVMRCLRDRSASLPDLDAMAQVSLPEQDLIAGERAAMLVAAVQRLPLPYRQVMTLLLEDLRYEEIAQALGISVSNVGVRISRAKRQLKEMLPHD